MKLIGLTGGIATGKSTVSNVFRDANVPIIDADVLARQVVEPGQPCLRAIAREFGDAVVDTHTGQLNRAQLGSIIFANPERRKALNAIVHPAVRWEMLKVALQYYLRAEPLVVLDVPLLFEGGLDRFVTKTMVVYCPKDVQLQRLMARDQLDEAASHQRIQSQMPLDEKCRRADIVVDNSGAKTATVQRVQGLICLLRPSLWSTYFWLLLPGLMINNSSRWSMPLIPTLAVIGRAFPRPAQFLVANALPVRSFSLLSRSAAVGASGSVTASPRLTLDTSFASLLLPQSNMTNPFSFPSAPLGQQVRFRSYGHEYQPSNLVRKRRHGYLARLRKKSGQRILANRRLKGRKNMSH
ncbi:Dephospho-CoA kinase [Dimargaris verticillata]|uniref:Large ribosomal subunit protein bL34m n=1 Tax=Dimargaris verticillata TaxID=2761393 RepID=A0A9W8EEZ6_9FUNG|nr:Dephospho-CoA kinase [Dimargaris verticillata]